MFVVAGRLRTAMSRDGSKERQYLLTCFSRQAVQGIVEISREATIALIYTWLLYGSAPLDRSHRTWRCEVGRLDRKIGEAGSLLTRDFTDFRRETHRTVSFIKIP